MVLLKQETVSGSGTSWSIIALILEKDRSDRQTENGQAYRQCKIIPSQNQMRCRMHFAVFCKVHSALTKTAHIHPRTFITCGHMHSFYVCVSMWSLTKRLVTHWTFVRFLSSVHSAVNLSLIGRSKCSITETTFLRFLACVYPNVQSQIIGTVKRLLALCALGTFLFRQLPATMICIFLLYSNH